MFGNQRIRTWHYNGTDRTRSIIVQRETTTYEMLTNEGKWVPVIEGELVPDACKLPLDRMDEEGD